MKKGEPKHDNKVDKPRQFASSAIRLLPDREVESAKGQSDRAAIVRA